jgi:hypothetical protein
MASFRGQDGSVLQGATTVAQVRSWSCDVQVDLLDASVMGDDWKQHRGGLASWTGSMEVLFDYADAGQAALVDQIAVSTPLGNPIAISLRVDGSSKLISGNVIIKAIKINDTLNDLVKFTCDFEGSGPPTLSWA